mgnify:CR=1 FL=1
MMKRWVILAGLLGSMWMGPAATADSADVAVIVSRQNEVDDISFHELVDIFKQDRQHWRAGKKK